jgi:hypothetical protein
MAQQYAITTDKDSPVAVQVCTPNGPPVLLQPIAVDTGVPAITQLTGDVTAGPGTGSVVATNVGIAAMAGGGHQVLGVSNTGAFEQATSAAVTAKVVLTGDVNGPAGDNLVDSVSGNIGGVVPFVSTPVFGSLTGVGTVPATLSATGELGRGTSASVVLMGGDVQGDSDECTVVAIQDVPVPAPPSTGTTVLTDTAGVLSWAAAGAGTVLPQTPGLRLSLTTGVPVTTADVTGATTLYYTPYQSGSIFLYNGSAWIEYSTPEVSLALGTLVNATNYDVFATFTGGAVVLSLVAWTNATTRATALVRQNGMLVQSGATTQLYLGTIRTTATTTTEDSALNRFVWNQYNQVPRPLLVQDATASWSYSATAYREARGVASNQFAYVTGDAATFLDASVLCGVNNPSGFGIVVGIGIDSTSANSAQLNGGTTGSTTILPSSARYKGYPGLGYHFVAWLESGHNGGTPTFYGTGQDYGDSDPAQGNSGMNAQIAA